MRNLKYCAVFALALLLSAALYAQPLTMARPSQAEVRAHVSAIVGILDDKYRVELRWDDPERVSLPNGSFMVGIPRSEIRDYYTITLPTWASPAQIAGMIDATLQTKLKAKRGSWIARAWRWVRSTQVKNVLVVPEPVGLYMVDQFSVPRVLD